MVGSEKPSPSRRSATGPSLSRGAGEGKLRRAKAQTSETGLAVGADQSISSTSRGRRGPEMTQPRIADEVTTRVAKDRIGTLVDRAALGTRTRVLSRQTPIAVIGPPRDLPRYTEAARVSTADIKSGRSSIKGILARDSVAILTVRGRDMASLRPALPNIEHASTAPNARDAGSAASDASRAGQLRGYDGQITPTPRAIAGSAPARRGRDQSAAPRRRQLGTPPCPWRSAIGSIPR